MSAESFATLDPQLPLALLPVRLEARYLPRRSPKHLCVRIFPDVIHADGHRPPLTSRELACAKQYWTSIWGVTDAALISRARARLAGLTTPYRALWVATASTPTNIATPTDPAPTFGEIEVDDTPQPVRAALLPDEWMVQLYDEDLNVAHTTFTGPVATDLAIAPSLSAAGSDAVHPTTGAKLAAPLAFLAGQDLLWTVDFDLAVEAGMGVRIPIANVPDPVGALVVLGIRAERDALQESAAVDALMTAHWYTRGFDAVAQGTPTNNSDAGRTGVSLSLPDVDALFERELHSRPLAPLGRALLLAVDAALLYRLPAADSLSLVVGRLQPNQLDHVAHAEWGEGAAAWAMNVAIGYATLATYLNDPFASSAGDTFAGNDQAALRDWYIDWVRGGATLPVIRCGEQPYGLLPITHRPARQITAQTFEAALEHQLDALRALWEAALPVPALDPEATDARPSGTETGDALIIADVLGAVPHPTALQLRAATNHLADDLAALYDLMAQIEVHAFGDNLLDPDHDSAVLAAWEARKTSIFGDPDGTPPVEPPDIDEQLANLATFEAEVVDARDAADYVTTAADAILALIADELRPLLKVYNEAVRAVPDQLAGWAAQGGLGTSDLVNLTATTFDDNALPVGDLVVDDSGIAGTQALIERIVDELAIVQRDGVPTADRRSLLESPAPLLSHLLHANYLAVPVDDIGRSVVALNTLLRMIDDEQVTDPVAELGRLTREAVGLAMYRLDAWITSMAAKLLAERRQKRPAGLQVGGFGWLLDLEQTDDAVSQGFVHAPSLAHASTAAVLRSGWSAFGTGERSQPLSVDLSSQRVRGAQWILDAVRNGQDLAEQLGARFERSLHDGHLDEWIETIRLLALDARGLVRQPTTPVDGLLVARSASGVEVTDQELAFQASIVAETAPTADPVESRRRAAVRNAWRRLGADLDAVSDLMMAQAVHSLIQGSDAQASAAMSVSGGGDAAVPKVDVTTTQRDAQLVHHRVLALWPAAGGTAPSGPGTPPARLAEPRLTGWLEGILPRPADVVAAYTLSAADGTVTATGTVTLAEVGLTAVEAALLAARLATQTGSRLGRVVAAAVSAANATEPPLTVTLDPGGTAPAGSVTLDEFGLLGAALAASVGRMRPARPADLVSPSVDASTLAGPSVADLDLRVGDVTAAVAALAASLAEADVGGDAETISAGRRQALLRCAAIGVRGAVRALEDGASAESLTAVTAELAARLSPPETPPSDPAEAAVARLATLIGSTVPILALFMPADDPDRRGSAGSRPRRRQAETDVPRWLYQAGRVRPDLGAVGDLLELAEVTSGRPVGPFGLAEMPHRSGTWSGVGLPSDSADRVSIVSLTGPKALATEGSEIAGVFIDGWTEGIPRPAIQTGIAVHFDAPSARPPQTILLSVVDDDHSFSAEDLSDQLLHTVALAKLRAVGPADLADIGHYFPAVALPIDITVSDTSEGA